MVYNSGYVGSKRSVRSERAISNYEVPMSQINKDMISEFIENADQNIFSDVASLPSQVSIWRWGAEKVGATSWHHTGKYLNRTNHYSLYAVAAYFQDNKDTYMNHYQIDKMANKIEKSRDNAGLYAYVEKTIWEGKYRKYKTPTNYAAYGIADERWVHVVTDIKDIGLNKVSLDEIATKRVIYFDTFAEMKNHAKRNFDNTLKKVDFNRIEKKLNIHVETQEKIAGINKRQKKLAQQAFLLQRNGLEF